MSLRYALQNSSGHGLGSSAGNVSPRYDTHQTLVLVEHGKATQLKDSLK